MIKHFIILSSIPETTNSSLVGESEKLPKNFRTLGMMPNTWFSLTKAASETNFTNPRLPPPYTKCNFLSAILRSRSMAASTNSVCLSYLNQESTQMLLNCLLGISAIGYF